MKKVDFWEKKYIIIFLAVFLSYILINSLMLKSIHPLFTVIYIVLLLFVYTMHLYFKCARCIYYANNCYFLGGKCAQFPFRPREIILEKNDDLIVFLLWAIFALFPAIVYMMPLKQIDDYTAESNWKFLIIHLIFTGIVVGVQQLLGCSMCKNESCIAYRK